MRTGPPPSSWLAEILRAAQHREELGVHIDAEVEAVLLLAVHDGLFSSRRVATSGMLGWLTTHRTARPTPGAAPDPHLHAHVTLINLARD
ncbi:relaxase domain-containing protein [Pilimelia columellifera]|uniref:TrwC relaxase domain-containing protein n=1 Tax=Pilimelia columellifera subsp. columellifera TaxID=706583 RepID=A0ABN3NSL7_9ACTN